jgi:hypothetical protein
MNSHSPDPGHNPSHSDDRHDGDALDDLLARDWLHTPPGFTQRVMRHLPRQLVPAASARPSRARWQRLRWLLAATGLVGSGVLGLSQLTGFIFGLWLASSAI